jgi:hypothetical protein
METVFRNQLVSSNQSLRGNVFAHSFPRKGLDVTILKWTEEKKCVKGGLNSSCLGQVLVVGFVNTTITFWIP